jgi:hypothetical protein
MFICLPLLQSRGKPSTDLQTLKMILLNPQQFTRVNIIVKVAAVV